MPFLFNDYIPVLLINMAAGLLMLACYVAVGLEEADQRRWAPGFAMTGLVALIGGFHMSFVWPLPGSYNIAYGELSVFFGILFAGAALALARGWDLLGVTIYAFLAGLCAIILGIRIWDLGMSLTPRLTCVGFVLTGVAGLFSLPVLYLRNNRALRTLGVIVLVVAALIWILIACRAYWQHLSGYAKWVPLMKE